MEEMFYNRHYITVDDQSRITDGWSDGPHPNRDASGAVCVNNQGGYQFRLPLENGLSEENPVLMEWEHMIPLYKWDGSQVLRRSTAEIEADRAAIPAPEPQLTQLDAIEAQVTYTAMMTDTLL